MRLFDIYVGSELYRLAKLDGSGYIIPKAKVKTGLIKPQKTLTLFRGLCRLSQILSFTYLGC